MTLSEHFYEVRICNFENGLKSTSLAGPFETAEEADDYVKEIKNEIYLKPGRFLGVVDVFYQKDLTENERE